MEYIDICISLRNPMQSWNLNRAFDLVKCRKLLLSAIFAKGPGVKLPDKSHEKYFYYQCI